MMTMRARVVHRGVRRAVSAAVVGVFATIPALAQEPGPAAPLNLSTAAAAGSSVPATGGAEPQAAGQSGNAALSFFSTTELSGFVDMYYNYNFNTPKVACATVGGVAVFNCLRNFDVAHNSFSLNLAEVAVERKPTAESRGGFRVDLDFGSATSIVHGFEPGGTGIYQHIQQGYISYLAPVGKGLQLDFGKFVTQHGAEVIETKDNWNYSRSLLFALAIPYYHMGVRAIYAVNDQVTLAGSVNNGWNNVVDNNTGKTLGAQLVYKPVSAVSVVANYMGGPEQTDNNDDWRHLFDATVAYTATPQVSLMANYDYGRDTFGGTRTTWQGIGGYVKYQPRPWFAVIPRAEYLDDDDTFMTGTSQKVGEVTLTAEFKHKDGVLMRVEYRGDFSDEPFFVKTEDDRTTHKKNQHSIAIGFVYAFSTKAP